jgi:hypothetical protein
MFTIAGDCAAFCSAGALQPAALELLELGGVSGSANAVRYTGREDFEATLHGMIAAGRTLTFQHLFPADEVPAESYWIPPSLLAELNDKANLDRFVPTGHCPPRTVMGTEEAMRLTVGAGQTIVIKGSTERSTGAGGAVVMARRDQQLRQLPERLDGCTRVVVEEFQPFERTMCLNWAADRSGNLHYIGSAEQVVDDEGAFLGSWIGTGLDAPDAAIAIGREIMTRAAARGYYGIAGFDMGVLPDGRVLAFDLNFRLCASTPALLWLPMLLERSPGRLAARMATMTFPSGFDRMCSVAAEAVRAGWLFPLSAFDPSRAGWNGTPPSVRGLVLGRDRAETEARCESLAGSGFVIR